MDQAESWEDVIVQAFARGAQTYADVWAFQQTGGASAPPSWQRNTQAPTTPMKPAVPPPAVSMIEQYWPLLLGGIVALALLLRH